MGAFYFLATGFMAGAVLGVVMTLWFALRGDGRG